MAMTMFKLLCTCVTLAVFSVGPIEAAPLSEPPAPRVVIQGAQGGQGMKPIELRGVDTRRETTGHLARTTVEMTFYNPNSRVLEGELQFPLNDGQTVTGFALEMGEGKGSFMRAAVPVEKAKGRQVFEEITRRRVDPALLEITQGNNFKVRVYPLNPGKTRRVRVTYDERLPDETDAPSKTAVYTGERDGVTYFYAEIPAASIPRPMVKRPPFSKVSILWDASASGQRRDHAKEFTFLDAFFAAERNLTVTLQQARDVAEPPTEFQVKDGDWSALRAALGSVVYDGATNLSAFDLKDSSDVYLLFSDGLDNYSAEPIAVSDKPLFAFISAPGSDTARLKGIGGVIDLGVLDAPAALTAMSALPPRVLSVEGGVSDVYYSADSPSFFAVSGIVTDQSKPVRVTFEAGEAAFTLSGQQSEHVPFIWASMKLERLEEEYSLNRGEIRRVGKAFSIPTRETSLIVLDTAVDYVRYDIEPPVELKKEYDKLRAASATERPGRDKLQRVLTEWQARQYWWKQDFFDAPPDPKAQETIVRLFGGALSILPGSQLMASAAPPESVRPQQGAAGHPREMRSVRREEEAYVGSAAPMAASVAPPAAPAEFQADQSAPRPAPAQEAANITIALRSWTPDAPYILRMSEARDEDLYRIYLDERPDWENSAAFYLDVSDQLKRRGQEALSLRVLSNLAEMNLENRQILRVLGYRLMEAGKAQQAVVIFTKVLDLGEEEPQSYRDLGLALAAAGESQKAIDRLYSVIEKDFPRHFPGIEVIALTELNAIIAASPDLDTSRIDSRFLDNMPLDIRAVLTWDTDNTDIDMHIIDPNNEEVFYSHPLSWQGGKISPDNTTGYGPEEFSLKQAKPGKYRVEVNFYGHNQQIISDSTTIQLDFFTAYGTPEQRKQSVTMRLRGARDRIVVGEFEVK